MQLYDITIAPGSTRQLDAPGSYFYYYAGSAGGADSTVTLAGLSSGLRLILKPGQAFRLPRGSRETSWMITNYAGAATIVGTVLVGDGEVTDNRITGSVEVIDGGKNRSLAGNSYSMAIYCGAVAATYSHMGINNPIGSGKNLIIENISLSVSSQTPMNIGWGNAYLGSLYTGGVSKFSGKGTSTSLQIMGTSASASPSGFNLLSQLLIAPASQISYKFTAPLIISPGYSLQISSVYQNTTTNAVIEYFEESAT